MNAEYYIKHLNLLPHPEGGYYKETYRSVHAIEAEGFDGKRSVSTAIYFLLRNDEKSHLHRIKSDELWFHHEGNSLEVVVFHNRQLTIHVLGKDIAAGELLQLIVPAGAWFGSRLKDAEGFALVSCTVAPGFDFKDFELAAYKKISREFPAYEKLLKEMCIN